MSFEDFNALPDLITEKIFKYLSFKDVCNVMLVSKKWHEHVGKSTICMDKIRLKLEGWHDPEIITNILLKNSRIYRAIVLNNLNPQKELIYLQTQDWREVCLQQMKFQSASELCEYLFQFGDNLEILELDKVIIVSGNEVSVNLLNLPRLRVLKLVKVPTAAFQIFPRYPLIKKLHFDIPAFGTHSRSLIINFFENFRNAGIEILSIRRNSLYGLSPEDAASIEKTISSLSLSLKKLELQEWGCCHTLERLWNQLKVSQFSINFCSSQPTANDLRNLVPSDNLKILEIFMLDIPDVEWFRSLCLLTPSLEHLYITKIRKEIVYYAACHLKKLKTFKHSLCVIDVRTQEFDSDSPDYAEIIELEDKNPGSEYNYIGNDEIFDLTGNAENSVSIERYSDRLLDKSFAKFYYLNLKSLPSMNQDIKFYKCDFINKRECSF